VGVLAIGGGALRLQKIFERGDSTIGKGEDQEHGKRKEAVDHFVLHV
jgi:hypothetical protein